MNCKYLTKVERYHVSGTIRKSLLKCTCHSSYPENPCLGPSHSINFHSMLRQLQLLRKSSWIHPIEVLIELIEFIGKKVSEDLFMASMQFYF